MLKVYVVDDSELVRERLIDMVSEIEEVEVVGETGALREAEASIGQLRPDAVILDIRLPDGNGITLLRHMKRDRPAATVIVLTNYPYSQYREECLDAGADYFLYKATEFDQVGEILSRIAGSGTPP
ncbi:MAG TPA: response regulator transcription factor [Syntrophobacteria bacterium]|nr:response regulator transcription factor [Syntrophobacteria bacterium]